MVKHRAKILDYIVVYEGDGHIEVDGHLLHVFIGGPSHNRFHKENLRNKELAVDLGILPWFVALVEREIKMIVELTRDNSPVPHYLFIGEIIDKEEIDERMGRIIFDCGVKLDVVIEKRKSDFKNAEKGKHILVIGRLDLELV